MSEQWHLSIADPDAPEGEQLVGFIAVDLDWPEHLRHHHGGITAAGFEVLFMGPVPEGDRTPPELCGRLLVTREDVAAAAGDQAWPYDDKDCTAAALATEGEQE